MQRLKDWFLGLKPRERAFVVGGAVAVLVAVVYVGVAPLYAAVNARAERVASKEGDLAWMRSVAGEIIALGADAPAAAAAPSDESLVVLVDRAARECGLASALTGQTPNGPTGIRVRLESAEFDKLVLCLANLQQTHAVSIESAAIDRTEKPGLVNASLVLNRAG